MHLFRQGATNDGVKDDHTIINGTSPEHKHAHTHTHLANGFSGIINGIVHPNIKMCHHEAKVVMTEKKN